MCHVFVLSTLSRIQNCIIYYLIFILLLLQRIYYLRQRSGFFCIGFWHPPTHPAIQPSVQTNSFRLLIVFLTCHALSLLFSRRFLSRVEIRRIVRRRLPFTTALQKSSGSVSIETAWGGASSSWTRRLPPPSWGTTGRSVRRRIRIRPGSHSSSSGCRGPMPYRQPPDEEKVSKTERRLEISHTRPICYHWDQQ